MVEDVLEKSRVLFRVKMDERYTVAVLRPVLRIWHHLNGGLQSAHLPNFACYLVGSCAKNFKTIRNKLNILCYPFSKAAMCKTLRLPPICFEPLSVHDFDSTRFWAHASGSVMHDDTKNGWAKITWNMQNWRFILRNTKVRLDLNWQNWNASWTSTRLYCKQVIEITLIIWHYIYIT